MISPLRAGRPRRRGGGPRTALPVTGRLRSPPYPAAAPDAPRPGVALAQGAPTAVKMSQSRTGTPRIVRTGSSSLNGAWRPAARDAPAARRLTQETRQPGGPDGEGQARGQAPMRAANLSQKDQRALVQRFRAPPPIFRTDLPG